MSVIMFIVIIFELWDLLFLFQAVSGIKDIILCGLIIMGILVTFQFQ